MFDMQFMTFYLLFLLDRVFVTVLDGVFLTLFAGDLLGHFDRDIDAVFLGNVHAMLFGDLFLHVVTFLALYLVTLLPWNLLWVLFEKKSCQFTYQPAKIDIIDLRTIFAARRHQICPFHQCQLFHVQIDIPSHQISRQRLSNVSHLAMSRY